MYFTSSVMPGLRAFASTLRVRLFNAPKMPARPPLSSSSPSACSALRANWRVCPMTGQRQQRWCVDDKQDPPSRSVAPLLQRAILIVGLHVWVRTRP